MNHEPFRFSETQKGCSEYNVPDGFNGVATARNPVYIRAIDNLMRWNKDSCIPNFIFFIRPGYIDHRISLQRSCFTFHGNDQDVNPGLLKEQHNDSLISYVIPGRSKWNIQKQLSYLGIDEFTIYGGLNSLSKSLRLEYLHAFRKK